MVTKLTGYGAVLSAPLTLAANGTQTITVLDTDIVAGTSFIIATIDPASTGTAQFASGGGQALVCIDTAGIGCDSSAVASTIAFAVTGTGGLGAVVVNIRLVDGVDGILGPPEVNDAGILSLAYTQVLPASGVVVTTAAPNLIAGLVGGAPALITVSVTDSGGTFIPGITVFASSSIGDFASDGGGVIAICDLTLPGAGAATPGSDATCSYASSGAADTLELHPDSVYGVAVRPVAAATLLARPIPVTPGSRRPRALRAPCSCCCLARLLRPWSPALASPPAPASPDFGQVYGADRRGDTALLSASTPV